MSDIPPVAPIMVGGYGKAGGYQFSEDEVDGVIKQWEDLRDELIKDKADADIIAGVLPPADEVASHTFVEQGANPSGKSLQDEHQNMVDYATNYITALRAAKNKISVNEQEQREKMDTKSGA
ncbi:hypothetical protein GCM10022222_17410 [Amycolatopsis ultiminotia]|uniref:PE family protein n=1 Tax=Amycolatopsis ultiminotia TaxID=543629 RepID=A0ABP6VEL7_9PSEU